MLVCRIPGALGVSRLCPGALDRGFKPWSKRTFCTSRRALPTGVVGTPRTGRSAQAGLRWCCITPTETTCWCAGFPGPWVRSGGPKSTRSRFQTLVQANFPMISTSSSDWCGRSIGVPFGPKLHRRRNRASEREVEPSFSDREITNSRTSQFTKPKILPPHFARSARKKILPPFCSAKRPKENFDLTP